MAGLIRKKTFDGDFLEWADFRSDSDWVGLWFEGFGCFLSVLQRSITEEARRGGRGEMQETKSEDRQDGNEHGAKNETGDWEHDKPEKEKFDWDLKVLRLSINW